MRTTLSIDDELAQGLMLATGQKTPVAAIRQALQEYLQQARKQEVLALRGQVDIEDRWRELRQAELAE
jgi:Arc/MetJ family transcription regulator